MRSKCVSIDLFKTVSAYLKKKGLLAVVPDVRKNKGVILIFRKLKFKMTRIDWDSLREFRSGSGGLERLGQGSLSLKNANMKFKYVVGL